MRPRHYAEDKGDPVEALEAWASASMRPRHYAEDKFLTQCSISRNRVTLQ